MKNILKVNIFFYVIFIITILTGNFKTFIIITLITIFHELGHIITGIICGFKIEKIVIVPFGLMTVFNKKINESFIKDFFLTIMGPVFQIFLFLFINDSYINRINLIILLFNLLPIIPLDGSKLINMILELIFSYKTSYLISFYISIITIVLLLKPTLTIILITIIYFWKNIEYIKNIKFYLNKFLFERYLYGIKYTKKHAIKTLKVTKIKKFVKNIFITNKRIINEEEIIALMFDKSRLL
ncbi:MAG: hypothetical protein RSH78_01075 [Bacilli bacterium]